jgi:uncharacterized RDD family membrane protein YckC
VNGERSCDSVARDLSIDPGRATLDGTLISIVLLLAVWIPHRALHGENAFRELFRATGGWWFAPSLLAGIAAHEALHAISWRLAGRLPARSVAFGVNWRVLMPFAHPRPPMPARAYALGAAVPGIVLGLVPAAAGLVTGDGAWSGWGALFTAAAAGDLLVLRSLRGLPGAALVRDHPTRVGCEVVGDPPADGSGPRLVVSSAPAIPRDREVESPGRGNAVSEPAPTMSAEQISSAYDSSIVVRRWGSTVFDYLLMTGALFALLQLPESAHDAALVAFLVAAVAYFPLLEWRFGATPGKWLSRTRVVGPDGRRPRFAQALVRTLLRLVEINPVLMGGIPAGIVVLASKKKQRLGDMAAGTFVLRAEDVRYLDHARAWAARAATAPGLEAPPPPPRLPSPSAPGPASFLVPTRRSGWAIAAGYLGLFALLVVPAPLALGAGLLALRDLRRDPDLGGRGRAIFALVTGSLGTLLLLVVIGAQLAGGR